MSGAVFLAGLAALHAEVAHRRVAAGRPLSQLVIAQTARLLVGAVLLFVLALRS